jgi:hypothetical protein
MKRAYYDNSITDFLLESDDSIHGRLCQNFSLRTLEDYQKNAWLEQIRILKTELIGLKGKIYFEFGIPRMGKRVDNIVILGDKIFILEFKVGAKKYDKSAEAQVLDYCLDLKNFHEGSHEASLIPVLICTEAPNDKIEIDVINDFNTSLKCNKTGLHKLFEKFDTLAYFDVVNWETSVYKPTPTIVEAARALYIGHKVEEISRSDAGTINLSKTSESINEIISTSKRLNRKSICFVTGVPGAGKTLAGLNIANTRKDVAKDEMTVFLSGNGPLVDVLREALARDSVSIAKEHNEKLTKDEAKRKVKQFIQNIHHFRDEYLSDDKEPAERVAIFDEAQRAWDRHQTSSFMKRKKGKVDFNMSEPQFLIDVMNRHRDWCTIVCLVGGGQELNTGEAGLSEWINALRDNYSDWDIYHSEKIETDVNYLKENEDRNWLRKTSNSRVDLHLSVSVRSFRTEDLSLFIHQLLEKDENASETFAKIESDFPFVLTRKLNRAKEWLENKSRASERIGITASSGARRLRPLGIDVKNSISAPNWFLNPNGDIRSSNFLEDVATEFDIQGLEIDWACVAWGANFYSRNNEWYYQNFKGTKWTNIKSEVAKSYLKNTYRVLLTRARQGLVIFIPEGDKEDYSRPNDYYDGTYKYLKSLGIKEI